MIRPFNINAGEKQSGFRCDAHDAYIDAVNVTDLLNEDHTEIIVTGALLRQGSDGGACDHSTTFPIGTNANVGPLSAALAQAS